MCSYLFCPTFSSSAFHIFANLIGIMCYFIVDLICVNYIIHFTYYFLIWGNFPFHSGIIHVCVLITHVLFLWIFVIFIHIVNIVVVCSLHCCLKFHNLFLHSAVLWTLIFLTKMYYYVLLFLLPFLLKYFT